MDSIRSQELSSRLHIRKSLQEIVAELTAPGKLMIQLNGWRNVCQTLDYIYTHWCDLFDNISGISFAYDGLCQVVGNICSAENLKKKVLIGEMFKITISSYKLDNERTSELLEGFDDLDRNLKKFSIWGCHFVILQVKLDPFRPFGARQVPFDNSEYFGIFSATAQSLGMVPIIQFKIELAEYREEKSISALMDIMNTITATFFDFDVDISCLIISPLLSFSLKDIAIKKNAIANAEILINALQQGLPPAIGGVIFASDGSYKTYSLLIDQLSKIINRIPWPIVCSYEWKVPHVLESDTRNEVLEKWTNKQRVIMKVFSLASEGKLITWKGKLTSDIPDYIVTHDYYDPKYLEAMLEPPT